MTVAKFCPECGTATNGAKFCPECGTATTIGAAASAPPEAPPAPVVDDDERELWQGTPDPVLSPVAARTTSYMLTTERLKIASGLLGRKGEQIELYRVRDVKVNRSLAQRARKRGDLIVTSADATAPVFTFESIADPDSVAELVRKQVGEARRRRGVIAREEF